MMLINDLDIRIIHATTGEIIRELTLNPAVDYQTRGVPTPDQSRTEGSRCRLCLATSHQVLPGMRTLGRGTVLFVNGGSGARPNAQVAGTSIAFAGEGAYAIMLHEVLASENVHVGQLIIPGAITPGHPTNDPAVLADTLWGMHIGRDTFRVFTEALDV